VNGTLYYLLGDHLGSTSLTTNASGQVVSEQRYKAWGEVRYASGEMPTKYTFTGQYSHQSEFGLMFFNARWLDVSLGRFTQADTVIPDGVQGLDRYAYANNSPLIYSDPSGHFPWLPILLGAGIGLAIGTATIPNIMPWDPPSMNTNRVADSIPGENITGWLINQMTTNATSAGVAAINENWTSGNPIKMDAAMQAWTSVVGTGATWDFKVDLEAAGLQNVILGDRVINYDAVANIHFGFVGRAAGFDNDFLATSAGIAQQMRAWETGNPDDQGACNTTSWCDHPFATWSIRFGSYLYDRYKDDLNALDAAAFAEALKDFIAEHGEPPAPPPGTVS
jgi:RHS repeat-associated protein